MPNDYKGLKVPADTETADGPRAFVDYTDSGPIPRFTSTAARDSAITAPQAGRLCAVGSDVQRYTGSAWVTLVPDNFKSWVTNNPSGLTIPNTDGSDHIYLSVSTGGTEAKAGATYLTSFTATANGGNAYLIAEFRRWSSQPSLNTGIVTTLYIGGAGFGQPICFADLITFGGTDGQLLYELHVRNFAAVAASVAIFQATAEIKRVRTT